MALMEIFDPQAPPRPVGIDLGTTHSLIAYMSDSGPQTIADCNGVTLLPSVVSYEASGHTTVGVAAKARAASHPRETISSAKRFMGLGAADAEAQKDHPYEFTESKDGEANVLRFQVHGKSVTPIEVSAEILRALKMLAEDELQNVGGAVITVPAYFDDAQRQATRDAARLAGFDVLRLLNEPTAAALAYGLEQKQNGCFVVYDLGGGTFDVTILDLEDGVFQVRSTGGDSALGGDDMDRVIANEIFQAVGANALQRKEPVILRQVLDAARALKHQLTNDEHATCSNPIGESPKEITVTRVRFEQLIAPMITKAGIACKRALKDAGKKAAEIDGVILVGGSTRVPAVRRYVEELFGKEPLANIDPDRVVALGAALAAHQIAGEGDKQDVLLLDVLPLSLGIEVGGGVVDKILPRNTTIPAAARAVYTTQEDNQTGFTLHVVQGERELAADCRSLAHFTLRGIPKMPAGMARLEVSFRVDENSLLTIAAREATTGIEQHIVVKPSYGLDDETVETMLLDALDHGEGDLEKRKLAELRVEGTRIVRATEKSVGEDAALLEGDEHTVIAAALGQLQRALTDTRSAAIRAGIEALDASTKAFAGRRMNRAIAIAISGKSVNEVESRVETALGIDEAHARAGFRAEK